MTEPVKRYNLRQNMPATATTFLPDVVVSATDYAALEAECERLSNELNNMRISWGLMQSEREAALKQVEGLRDLLADWSSHFTGPKVIGGPLSSLRERTEEALSPKP